MMSRDLIIETVNRLFVAVDSREWNTVKSIFSETVILDYSSMSGGEPAELSADTIIQAWKALLPGFDQTHHQLGNYLININPTTAEVFCYGTATHYLSNESKNNLWTVVGTYDLILKKAENDWKICQMKFNLRYIDGNNDLPVMAKNKLNGT